MRCIFNKYENDSRYRNNVESLSKIFNMYLFVIPATCDLVERFNEKSRNSFSANERNSILICFLYVIRYIDKNVLLQWVEKESSNRLVSLLQCLSLVGSTFQVIH